MNERGKRDPTTQGGTGGSMKCKVETTRCSRHPSLVSEPQSCVSIYVHLCPSDLEDQSFELAHRAPFQIVIYRRIASDMIYPNVSAHWLVEKCRQTIESPSVEQSICHVQRYSGIWIPRFVGNVFFLTAYRRHFSGAMFNIWCGGFAVLF